METHTPTNKGKNTESQTKGTMDVRERLFSKKNLILLIGILIAVVISIWYPLMNMDVF